MKGKRADRCWKVQGVKEMEETRGLIVSVGGNVDN